MTKHSNFTIKSSLGNKVFTVLLALLMIWMGTSCGNETGDSDKGFIESAERTTASFLSKSPIGFEIEDKPQISNLAVEDLNEDGLLDVLVCDSKRKTLSWIRQNPDGTYTEEIISSELTAPAHVEVDDFDEDGDKDLLVADLGMLFPNNDKIGSVIILENDGNTKFKKRIIVENVARVTDVRAGDLDGDGDKDLAVAQFGYDDGETRWIENLGNWEFESHALQSLSGPVNVEITDIDQDGDLDMVSLVSQEWEEIYCFVNDGKGNFEPRLLWGATNDDFGSSGIILTDINQDGKEDILYTNGDSFDYVPPMPRPWQGVQWLENKGDYQFEFHRICNFPGAFSARACDIDKDGDTDIFVVSGFNKWDNPEAESFIWLENDGSNRFTKHFIANTPTHLIAMEIGDFNEDGHMDMVTGGLHVYAPFEQMSRVTLWKNNGSLTKSE
ncbi:MAG: VCBS repeat-containing protein [Bacteroidota bacterium]